MSAARHTTHIERSVDGLRLFEHHWTPDTPPRGLVVFVHGVLEHAGRYADFSEELVAHGLTVVAPDHRGHGRSEGHRIWVRTFQDLVDDLDRCATRVVDRYPNLPLFVLGQSMGGAVACRWAIERQPAIAGLVLCAPAIVVGRAAKPWIAPLGALANVLCPRLRALRLGVGGLARDAAAREAFLADPLIHHEAFAIRMGVEILRAGRWIRRRAALLHAPLLALHGTADRATDAAGTERFVQRAGSADKTFIAYPGHYHDLFHDLDNHRPRGHIVAWLKARMPEQVAAY